MRSLTAVRFKHEPNDAAKSAHMAWGASAGAVLLGHEDESTAFALFDVSIDEARKISLRHPCAEVLSVSALSPPKSSNGDVPPPTPPKKGPNEGFVLLSKTRSSAADGKQDALVIVDPLSTGGRLAAMAASRGYEVVRLMSQAFPEELLAMLPAGCEQLQYAATLQYCEEDPARTVAQLRALPYHILGVLIGCESGVECFDVITEALGGFPTNGVERSLMRRDKYPMGEAVRAAGLRAVKQQLCTSWQEAELFVQQELGVRDEDDGNWCVLKPCKSAGTDGVFMCKSLAESRQRFGEIFGHCNVFGERNASVLVQELMKGVEFVVDSVSVEGVHKCTAIWVYDKRPCNDAQFVYYGIKLYQTADGGREDALVRYVFAVLDALGVRHGPSHAEVMWLEKEDEPCLVEVGCRPHGGEGTFVDMVTPTIGYSKLDVMLDAIDKPYRFHRLPARPAKFSGGAFEVCLISHEVGTLKGYPGKDLIRNLPSFLSEEYKLKEGEPIGLTVDFLTTPGSIMLMHSEAEQVEKDAAYIHEISKPGGGLYDITPLNKFRLRSF